MTWGLAEYKGLPGRETSLTLPPSPALEAALLSWDPDRPTPPRDLLLDHRITAGLLVGFPGGPQLTSHATRGEEKGTIAGLRGML